MTFAWEIENDYEIKIADVIDGEYTGDFLSLGGDEYCGVRFDGVGSPDLRESKYDVSGGDGVRFGIERYGGVNWTITGAIHGTSIANAPGDPALVWESWSKIARAWTDYPGRTESRAVVPLYFKRPGREEMVVFGRPRRIDPDTALSHSGFIAYTALFAQSDPRFYSAQETTVEVLMTASTPGGIVMNEDEDAIVLPFQTTEGVARAGSITNEGDTSSNPLIRIYGPITSPQIVLYGDLGVVLWSAQLNMTIPDGSWIEIDARHHMRAIVDQDGTSFAGYYRGVKLQDLAIPPGTHSFDFQGSDETGTSSAQIFFRNAWSST